MDLGPTWLGNLALLGALASSLLLGRLAWRRVAPERADRARGLLLWWVLAIVPWFLLWIVVKFGMLLPHWLLATLSGLAPDWDTGTPTQGLALLVFVLTRFAHATLLVGLPLAAMLATGRLAWQEIRGSRSTPSHGV